MIEFTHTNTRFTVLPQNAQAYRAALDKPAKHKPLALSSKNLTRQYPAFLAGHTTTAEYVRQFQSQFNGMQHPIEHTCANYYKPAMMLDPMTPEVIEELDPDYVPPINTAPVRKPSAAKQLVKTRAAIHRALCALSLNNSDKAAQILREALA